VILIVTLAAVLAVTTFLEAAHGREYTQWYIYRTWWFVALLGLLAVNIFTAAAIRFPWRTSQTGFVITHAGLLVLLAGAVVTFVRGIEGQMTVIEGRSGSEYAVTSRSQISVRYSGGERRPGIAFVFEPGPVDWPHGESLELGERNGVSARVLAFYRHARFDGQFWPVEFDPKQENQPDAAALIEIKAGGQARQFWLRRNDTERGAARILTPEGQLDVSFGYERRDLDFSLGLTDVEMAMNPGRQGAAAYTSRVRLVDPAAGIDEKRVISMNEPLVHGRYTFYQSGYHPRVQKLDDGWLEASTFSIGYDPGRFLKYFGSVMICAGVFVMFYMRKGPLAKLFTRAKRDNP